MSLESRATNGYVHLLREQLQDSCCPREALPATHAASVTPENHIGEAFASPSRTGRGCVVGHRQATSKGRPAGTRRAHSLLLRCLEPHRAAKSPNICKRSLCAQFHRDKTKPKQRKDDFLTTQGDIYKPQTSVPLFQAVRVSV